MLFQQIFIEMYAFEKLDKNTQHNAA